jgi:hypothetical protein
MTFNDLYLKLKGLPAPNYVIGIDPGETTGICCFKGTSLIASEQLGGKDVTASAYLVKDFCAPWINMPGCHIVTEDYKVYSNKRHQHVNSSLYTPRLIGALELLFHPKKLHKQMASVAKGFCTDDKLEEWGYWIEGERHARDSIRHACYYILFRKEAKRVG